MALSFCFKARLCFVNENKDSLICALDEENSYSSYSQMYLFFKVIKNRKAFHIFFVSYESFFLEKFLVVVPEAKNLIKSD